VSEALALPDDAVVVFRRRAREREGGDPQAAQRDLQDGHGQVGWLGGSGTGSAPPERDRRDRRLGDVGRRGGKTQTVTAHDRAL
jgi:hypothetical protein